MMLSLEGTKVIISAAALGVAIVGSIVTLNEYNNSVRDKRIERVFEFANDFREKDGGYAGAVRKVDELAEKAWPVAAISWEKGDAHILNEINTRSDLRDEIGSLVAFFDALAVCVSERLCDERTARALFAKDLEAFRDTIYPWIVARQVRFKTDDGRALMCLNDYFIGVAKAPTNCPEASAQEPEKTAEVQATT